MHITSLDFCRFDQKSHLQRPKLHDRNVIDSRPRIWSHHPGGTFNVFQKPKGSTKRPFPRRWTFHSLDCFLSQLINFHSVTFPLECGSFRPTCSPLEIQGRACSSFPSSSSLPQHSWPDPTSLQALQLSGARNTQSTCPAKHCHHAPVSWGSTNCRVLIKNHFIGKCDYWPRPEGKQSTNARPLMVQRGFRLLSRIFSPAWTLAVSSDTYLYQSQPMGCHSARKAQQSQTIPCGQAEQLHQKGFAVQSPILPKFPAGWTTSPMGLRDVTLGHRVSQLFSYVIKCGPIHASRTSLCPAAHILPLLQ